MPYPGSMNTSDFGARLRARSTELRALRDERGATDPVLIIAGIAVTLILLVGGSFAMTGFISNAQNVNAASDLDRVATAQQQVAFMKGKEALAASTKYLYAEGKVLGPYKHLMAVPADDAQGRPDIDVILSDGVELIVMPISLSAVKNADLSWVAYARSSNGSYFMRTSDSTKAWDFGKASYPASTLRTPDGLVGSQVGGVTVTAEMAEQFMTDIRAFSHSYYVLGGE